MKILVVEDQKDIREIISLMLESQLLAEVIQAESGNEAIHLVQTGGKFDCIVSDYQMPNGTGEDLYRYILSHERQTPFILCSSYHPAELPLFKENPPFGNVVKPELFPALSDILSSGNFGTPQLEYFGIRTNVILRFGLLHCDFYIKLNDQKYVRVTREDDLFDTTDYERFKAKDVEFLYIKTEEAKNIINCLTEELARLLEKETISLEPQIEISTSALEVVTGFNKTLGMSPEIQELTKVSIKLALKTIRENPDLSQLYAKITVDRESYLASHSIILAHLACGISSLLGWTSDAAFYKLSLAAFLHDITLGSDELAKIDELRELEVHSFSAEEKIRFKNHPETGAALLNRLNNVPQDVGLIVAQHHERPDGTGFPAGIQYSQISPMSALLIVAEDIIVFREKISSGLEISQYINSLDISFSKGQFRKITEALTHAYVDHLNGETS